MQIKVHKSQEFIGHKASIFSLSPSDKPGRFISCGSEGIVAEWHLATGEGKAVVEAPASVFAIAIVPNRNLLLLGLQNGEVVFVDLVKKKVLKRVQLHQKSIFDFLILPDQLHFLASAEDGKISIWNLDRLDHIHLQQISSKSIRTIVLNADSSGFFAGSSDNYIREFDLGLNAKRSWKAHKLSIFRLLRHQNQLFSAGRDAHISKWDISQETPKLLEAAPAHNFAINDLVFNDDHQMLMSGSMDKSIKIWEPHNLKLLKVINFEKNQCHWNGVNRLLWLEGSLLSCSDDRKIMRWEFS